MKRALLVLWMCAAAAAAAPKDGEEIDAKIAVTRVMPDGVFAMIQYWDYDYDAAGKKISSNKCIRNTVEGFVAMDSSKLVDGDTWAGKLWRAGRQQYGGATVARFAADPKAAKK